jgi:excisionase family DNA binding protein
MPNKLPNESAAQRGAYKLRNAAKYLDISVPSLHRLIARGQIRPCRQLRHILISRQQLDKFLEG